MKTLKKKNPKTNEIEFRRVDDRTAESQVKLGWSYCPKSEWKSEVRDISKAEAKRLAAEKAETKAREKAEKKSKKV